AAELDVLDVRDLLAEIRPELLLESRLDLADALARDAVLVADLLERHGLLVAHERFETALVDDEVLALQRLLELGGLLADEAVVLVVGDAVRGARRAGEEVEHGRVLALVDGRVHRDVARAETLLHLDDLGLLHAEALGDELRLGREALALEALLLLLEVEEEL